MNSTQVMEVLTGLLTKTAAGTEVLMDELLRFILITTLMRIGIVFVITGLVVKSFSAAISYMRTFEHDLAREIWTGVLRALLLGAIVGSLVYSYTDIILTVKVLVAPHVYMMETLKKLVQSIQQ